MTAPHGTYRRYAARATACRCPRCRKAKREYVAARRAAGLERDNRARHDPPRALTDQRRAQREHLAARARRHVEALYRAGLTQTAVAASIGVDRRTLAGLTAGRIVPRPDTSRRIIAAAAPRQRRTA